MAHLPNNPDKESQYDRRLPVHLSVRRKYSSFSYVCYRIEQDPFPSTRLYFVLTIWGPNIVDGGALRKHTQPQRENFSRQSNVWALAHSALKIIPAQDIP
jgi:hypothetical protein